MIRMNRLLIATILLLQSQGIAYATQCISQYGADGTIDQQKVNVLRHLAFPQTYRAVVSRLGYPEVRCPDRDFYRAADDSGWLIIFYDPQNMATHWEVWRR